MGQTIDRRQLKLDAKNSMRGRNPSVYVVTLVFLLILYVLGVLETRLIYPNMDAATFARMGQMTEEEVMALYQSMIAQSPGFAARALTTAIEIMGAMLGIGFTSFCLSVSRGQEASFGHLFDAFGNFLRLLLLVVLVSVFVFLWSLLLVVPGIIAAYRYSMAFFILLDDPDKSPMVCLRESKEMTRGHKMELFTLDLSFLGWYIISAIPFVSVYVRPYTTVTKANYYRALSGKWEEPVHIDFDI